MVTTASDVIAFFRDAPLREDETAYLRFHRARCAYLLDFVEHAATLLSSDVTGRRLRVLDIGPAFQTVLLRARFPEAEVNTLGLATTEDDQGDFMKSVLAGGDHWTIDLNESANRVAWPAIPEHDVVVMAEVIEHLYTAPEIVLTAVSGFLRELGYLVLQTPNACALHKRLKMLVGKHPFGPIEECRTDSHFREYTKDELVDACSRVGLAPIRVGAANYFRRDSALSVSYNAVARILPSSLRAGITMTLRKSREREEAGK